MGNNELVVAQTKHFRAHGWPGVEDWIVISMDLGGNPIGVAADGSVWISNHDGGGIPMVAPTFEAFVEQLLGEAANG